MTPLPKSVSTELRFPKVFMPEGYIEIDMDGDDELIDAMTYDEWITQPETTC